MSSSVATYLVLVTAGLSVTYLSYMMYAAYGLGALKAAAPFIGSVSIVFGECGEAALDLCVRYNSTSTEKYGSVEERL